jgi:hypothetical protein
MIWVMLRAMTAAIGERSRRSSAIRLALGLRCASFGFPIRQVKQHCLPVQAAPQRTDPDHAEALPVQAMPAMVVFNST